MDPTTEHERPTKRVKRVEAGGTPISHPASHGREDSDEEEHGFVNNGAGAAHGSDLYLDTVRIV
jgi:hypothetical protein